MQVQPMEEEENTGAITTPTTESEMNNIQVQQGEILKLAT